MRNQSRCILAMVLAVFGLTTVAYPNDSATDKKSYPYPKVDKKAYPNDSAADKKKRLSGPTGLIPFELGKPIPVLVKFETDITDGNLFSLRKIEFQLNKESHLTAKISMSYTTCLIDLDTITYNIHAAVFDSNGKLLGTANAPRKIYTGATFGYSAYSGGEMSIDFGISLNYDKAKYFALAISEPEIKKRVAKQPTE